MIKALKLVCLSVLVGSLSVISNAQEVETTVIDEVVAQVNDSVITLSQVNRAKEIAVSSLVASGKKKDEAELEVAKREGELISSLITEEILKQKATEIGLDRDVDDEVNRRLLRLAKENKLNSLDDLFKLMRSQNVNPEAIKQDWRSKIVSEAVYRRVVDGPLFWGTPDKDVKEYYTKNKTKFAQQETVELSEILLLFAGKQEADVQALANSLVKRARSGEDFGELAVTFSDRLNKEENKGRIGEFHVEKLKDDVKAKIKGKRTGDVLDPIKVDETGIQIIRIDKYVPASSESNFDERLVRDAILNEKRGQARKDWLAEQKRESYIKVSEDYRGAVMPFLRNEPSKTAESKITDLRKFRFFLAPAVRRDCRRFSLTLVWSLGPLLPRPFCDNQSVR